ncbi:MAG: hypothetical protein HOY71_23005 [Nonomuraea sp.]|nr:hypothetical protein [Nonomuraea sp.]
MWPRAVRELPPELAGEPLSALVLGADGGTLIVGRQHDDVKSKEGPVTRAVYAVGTTTRKLFDLPERASAAGNLAVGAGRLVWTTRPDRVWVASLRDGRPRSLGSLGLGTIDGLTVEEGRIILSVAKGGVYAMPLSGGRPRLLAKGAHLLRWPWVGATERLPYRTFVRLTDLQLGRHDTAAVRPADRDLRCGLVYCSGFTEDGAAFTRMRDGSEQRPYPGNMHQIIGDRLAITELPGNTFGVRDLATGTEAALGRWFADNAHRYLTYGRGDKAFVMDRAAIR